MILNYLPLVVGEVLEQQISSLLHFHRRQRALIHQSVIIILLPLAVLLLNFLLFQKYFLVMLSEIYAYCNKHCSFSCIIYCFWLKRNNNFIITWFMILDCGAIFLSIYLFFGLFSRFIVPHIFLTDVKNLFYNLF